MKKYVVLKFTRYLCCILGVLSICETAPAQIFIEWERVFATSPVGTVGEMKMFLDPCGEFVVVASSYDDPTEANNGVVAKYDHAGNLLWKQEFNGAANGNDRFKDVAVDANGDVYAAGFTTDAFGQTDMLVVKYNAQGAFVWAKTHDNRTFPFGTGTDPNGTDKNEANAITLDGSAGLYITGKSTPQGGGAATPTDAATVFFSRSTGSSIEVGRFVSATGLGSEGMDIVFNPLNNHAYAAINALETLLPHPPPFGTLGNEHKVFFGEYNSTGTFGSSSAALILSSANNYDNYVTKIAINPANGNIYGTGKVKLAIPIDPNYDIVTFKVTTSPGMVLAWKSLDENPTIPTETDEVGTGIVIDASENVYVSAQSSTDMVAIKYNTSGVRQWISTFDGATASPFASGKAVAIDQQNGVYIAGGVNSWQIQKRNQASGAEFWTNDNNTIPVFRVAEDIAIGKNGVIYTIGTAVSGGNIDLKLVKHGQSCYDNFTKIFNMTTNTSAGVISGIHKGKNKMIAGTSAANPPLPPGAPVPPGIVTNNLAGDVELKAGRQIILLPNFRAVPSPSGFHFLAKIDLCQHTSCESSGATEFERPGPTAVMPQAPSEGGSVKIYPNPTNSGIYIEHDFANDQIKSIRVMDVSGKVCREVSNISGNKPIYVATKNLRPGMYFVGISLNDQNIVRKVIVLD